MKRVDSVISLIYSLSKSEKKHFSLQVIKDKEEKDYLVIYDIIIKSKQPNGNTVKEEFYRRITPMVLLKCPFNTYMKN